MDLIDSAVRFLGYRESGDNNTKFGQWIGSNYQPWCHSFVSYNANEVGILNTLVPSTASTTAGMEWYVKRGRFGYKGSYTPSRNDLVYFKTGRSHVGIVESVNGNTLVTIEGNSGDAVMRRHYSLNNATITGYGKVAMYMSNRDYNPNAEQEQNMGKVQQKVRVLSVTENGKNKKQYDATEELTALANYKKLAEKKVTASQKYGLQETSINNPDIKVILQQGKKKFVLECLEPLKITFSMGAASICEFTCFRYGVKFNSGNVVQVYINNKLYWQGYIMSYQCNGERYIDITAYDQLIYLQSKDVVIFKKKTATEVLKYYANKEKLALGTVAKTQYIHTEIFDGSSIYEIIDTFLSKDLIHKSNEYILYDSKGKIMLRNILNLVYNGYELSIDTCKEYTYTEDLTDGFYNEVICYYANDKTGTYDLYKAMNDNSIARYGRFTTTEQIQTQQQGKLKANALLDLYSKVPRKLSVSDCLGNIHVRDGTIIPVNLELENMNIKNYMIVSAATHTFAQGNYVMDLTLKGAKIVE